MQKALSMSLDFVSFSEASSALIGEKTFLLRQELVNIHQLLGEYRAHEARELLIEKLEQDIIETKSIEERLSR
jgi:UDP-galactopyranose mutase